MFNGNTNYYRRWPSERKNIVTGIGVPPIRVTVAVVIQRTRESDRYSHGRVLAPEVSKLDIVEGKCDASQGKQRFVLSRLFLETDEARRPSLSSPLPLLFLPRSLFPSGRFPSVPSNVSLATSLSERRISLSLSLSSHS